MPVKIKKSIILSGLFFLGFSGVLVWRIYKVQQIKPEPFVPQKSDFRLQPPISALTGTITEIKGEVKKRGREDKDFSSINAVTNIIEGENFATGTDALLSLNFTNIAKINVEPNSEISLANLIPEQFLLVQPEGNIRYEVLTPGKSVSVRSLHLLTTLVSGSVNIKLDKEQGRVILDLNGSTKIAYVNTDNKTQVLELTGGKLIFDDATRTVQIVKS